MAITLRVEKQSKTWPPLWLISKETLLLREASTSDLSQFPTCPERPDLHVLVSMAEVYLKYL
ncbi:hypothetical protein I79_017674 [Cricetulus griseus]|uniref:Uncharacterized protein n=1 Tax=Cricetulus griseus TaxID=10029 RepID=G3I2N3_CRIGR|nr:hypothetical protein I79_017674 [Cricetulus griseus]